MREKKEKKGKESNSEVREWERERERDEEMEMCFRSNGCRKEGEEEEKKEEMSENTSHPRSSQVKWTHVFSSAVDGTTWSYNSLQREGIGLRTQLISVISRLFKSLCSCIRRSLSFLEC